MLFVGFCRSVLSFGVIVVCSYLLPVCCACWYHKLLGWSLCLVWSVGMSGGLCLCGPLLSHYVLCVSTGFHSVL